MKRGICLIVTLLLALTFHGCNSNNVTVEIFTNLNIQKYEDENSVSLIKNHTDLMTYCDEIKVDQYNQNFKSQIMSYDESFFETKMLVLLYYWDETASSELSIKEVEIKDNNVNVSINRDVPKIVSDTMKDYFFIIEVQQDESCDSVTYEVK